MAEIDDRSPVRSGFGYAEQFPRVLRRFALFAVAFSIVSITTGIFVNYSYGLTQLGPASVWLWPVAAVGQFLVVLVLAELAGLVQAIAREIGGGAQRALGRAEEGLNAVLCAESAGAALDELRAAVSEALGTSVEFRPRGPGRHDPGDGGPGHDGTSHDDHDGPGNGHHRGVTEPAALTPRCGEPGRFRGDRQVGARHQLTTGCGRQPVDPSHHRLGKS